MSFFAQKKSISRRTLHFQINDDLGKREILLLKIGENKIWFFAFFQLEK